MTSAETITSSSTSSAEQSGRPATQRLFTLQWIRFLAALVVVFYHASGWLQMLRNDTWATAFVPNWTGLIGVSIFFALSGNLMASAMQRQDAAQFLLHRVARIYPAFFLAVLFIYPLSLLQPFGFDFAYRALTLMPSGSVAYPLGVEWTLIFEIVFYVFVFGLILFRKQKQAVVIIVGWLGIILAHNILKPDNPALNLHDPSLLPFLGVNVGFAAGMLLALTVKRAVHPVLAGIIGVDVWLLAQTLLSYTGMRWGMGFGCAIFVMSAARYDGCKWLFGNTLVGRIGNRLGDYSYALYLIHVPVIRIIYLAFPNVSGTALFFVVIAVAVAASALLGEIDLRLYRFLKARIDSAEPVIRGALAAIYLLMFFGVAIYSSQI